jgi:uncharacterized protein (TIGR00730 family)
MSHSADSGHRAVPLAYKNEGFLEGDDGRPVRILAEYLQPLHEFEKQKLHDTIVFFGSARLAEDGPLGRYYDDARTLARRLTEWSMGLSDDSHRFVVCTGGGPGIMEAANRGATEAGGRTVGLNIGLPHEQRPNEWITPGLCFEFHYFFMRKLWFAHLARAIVCFPGGFGTLDEMFEVLTLSQTGKLDRRIPVVLYGSQYWREIVDFEAMARHGMIAAADLDLFHFVDTPDEALTLLRERLPSHPRDKTPSMARSIDAATPATRRGSAS